MQFGVRNVCYLRISAHTILTTVLYLDQRHVRWLNENPELWQRAVTELLRPRAELCEADTFKLLFYFQEMDHTHGVLLKFPGRAVPLDEADAPSNAAVPPRSDSNPIAVKEEPLDDGAPLFIPESDEEHEEHEEPSSDEDVKIKPKVKVSYAGFTIFGKELVCVLEPTAAVLAADPALFHVEDDGSSGEERRQLQSRARVVWDAPAAGPARSQRQYGREERREDTPLFRGMTPADEL